MANLETQLKEILISYDPGGKDKRPYAITKIKQAVMLWALDCVEEDEAEPDEVPSPIDQPNEYWQGLANNIRNILRAEIHQRIRESLGEKE